MLSSVLVQNWDVYVLGSLTQLLGGLLTGIGVIIGLRLMLPSLVRIITRELRDYHRPGDPPEVEPDDTDEDDGRDGRGPAA